jgi:hypothetical protein
MKLNEFERSPSKGGRAHYLTRIADDEGNEYHLVILGSDETIQSAFAEGEFNVTVTPGGSPDEWEREMEAVARRIRLGAEVDVDQLESFFKASEAPPGPESRVAVLLRPAGSNGTFFRSTLRFGVPPRTTLTFSLPPVFACFGQLLPEAADPDLLLRLNGPAAPVVKSSQLGGTSVDTVFHLDLRLSLFTPFFDVFGFQSTTTAITVFDFGGLRLP